MSEKLADSESIDQSLPLEETVVQEWVRQSREGDEDAFAKIVQTFAGRLQSMLYRMLLDWDDARDVAQETFIHAHQALSRYQPSGRFHSWLFQIAARRAIDVLRKRKRRPQPLAHGKAEEVLNFIGIEDPSAHRNELIQAIEQAVVQLPPEQRAAFVLAEYEGCTHREIAEVMGGSPKRAEMHVYRARQALRQELKRYLSFS